jgi:hypothetical protein
VSGYSVICNGYVPTINKAPVTNIVDPYLPHIVKILETAKEQKVFIPTTPKRTKIYRTLLSYRISL